MSAPHAPSAAQQINKAKDVLYDVISDCCAMNNMWSVFHVVALRCTTLTQACAARLSKARCAMTVVPEIIHSFG